MRTVIQRVLRAAVRVEGTVVGAIDHGALLLVGITPGDRDEDAITTVEKVKNLRFFPGRTPMDRTLAEVKGGCLVVSQFTLAAGLKKGNRPSFDGAASPHHAEPLYDMVVRGLMSAGLSVATGRFGARMEVELVNDGPVTFVLDVTGGRIMDTVPGQVG